MSKKPEKKKNLITTNLSEPSMMAIFLMVIGAGALATAYTAQYVFHMLPCELCLFQRIPYVIVLACGGAMWVLREEHGSTVCPTLAWLAGLTFAAGTMIAGFHVGVELHWWAGTEACGSPLPKTGGIEALKKAIMSAPAVRCDQVNWTFLGISFPGYNFMFSMLFAGLTMTGAHLMWKEDKE